MLYRLKSAAAYWLAASPDYDEIEYAKAIFVVVELSLLLFTLLVSFEA